jgi:hypothetical protein
MQKTEQLIETMAGMAPEVADQIITYTIWMSIIWLAIGVIGAIGTILLLRLGYRWMKEEHFNDPHVPCFIVAAVLGLCSLCLIILPIKDLVMCWAMPKLIILNYLMSGLRSN